MYALKCPRCGKLLGKSHAKQAHLVLLLYCKRCRRQVKPITDGEVEQ